MKRVSGLVLILVILIGSFGYGLVVSEFEVWPYRVLQPVWGKTLEILYRRSNDRTAIDSQENLVRTNLLNLRRSTYLASRGGSGCCHGGGIVRSGNTILVVDADGRFFRYTMGGVLDELGIHLETGRKEFVEFAGREFEDRTFRNQAVRNFRILDILVGTDGGARYIAVSYHFWDADLRERTTRVSRLPAETLFSNPTTFVESGEGWELLFVSTPPLGPDDPLHSNRTGGRMTVAADGSLIVGIGNNELYFEDGGAQSASGSYGKLIRIMPGMETGILANGIRNPQGLMTDSAGIIWETEHGPRGGDELNLIVPGENYGWPHVTLGTDYNELTWRYGTAGRHDGYRWPVYSWVPSIAVSSLIQVGDVPAEWAGDFLVGSLRGSSLHRLKIVDGRVVLDERIPIGHRIRDLEQTDDGTVLLYTDDGRMIELAPRPVPASQPSSAPEAASTRAPTTGSQITGTP